MNEDIQKKVAPEAEATIKGGLEDSKNLQDKYKKIPLSGFTEDVQKFIVEVSETYQTPRDIATLFALTAIGASLGNKVKSDDGRFINYPQLYSCACAKVGTGKTPVFNAMMFPLREADKALYREYKQRVEEWESDKSDKKGKMPTSKTRILNNITPECLIQKMSCCEGNIYAVDELNGFFGNFNKYHAGDDEERFLSFYNNTQFSEETKTEGCSFIDNPVLSIMGGIQPSVLRDTFCKKNRMSNGLFHRFCFVYVPDVIPQIIDYEKQRSVRLEMWKNYIQDLQQNYNVESVMSFDESAKMQLQTYVNATKLQKILEFQNIPDKANIWEKSDIFLHRISLIFAIGKKKQRIEAEDVKHAVEVVKALCSYSEQIVDYIQESNEEEYVSNLKKPDVTRLFFEQFPEAKKHYADLAKLCNVSDSYFRNTINRGAK